MSRATTLPSPWRELADRVGGVAALAELLGAAPRTLRQWAAGDRVPGAIVRKSVNAVFRRRGFTEPFAS